MRYILKYRANNAKLCYNFFPNLISQTKFYERLRYIFLKIAIHGGLIHTLPPIPLHYYNGFSFVQVTCIRLFVLHKIACNTIFVYILLLIPFPQCHSVNKSRAESKRGDRTKWHCHSITSIYLILLFYNCKRCKEFDFLGLEADFSTNSFIEIYFLLLNWIRPAPASTSQQ